MSTRFESVAGCLLAVAFVMPAAQAGVNGYYQFPTIHGDTVVFSCEGDLWQVSATGGAATRLTTHEGQEAFAHFSPDGKWLAFSAEYSGNVDVYVMPAGGGEPRRLTFTAASEQVVGWRPDGQSILFRRSIGYPSREVFLFEEPFTGGQPRKIEIGPAAQVTFSGDGKLIAFNRWAMENHTWKRYHGGTADDVWVGDFATKTFRKITDWPGGDSFPMWHSGHIYYISDRTDVVNVWSARPDGSDLTQHTKHSDYDVRWPSMDDAGHVVYMQGGDLWLLDVESGADRKIEITLPSDRVHHRPRFEDASPTVDHYSLDREGKHVAISSRGEMWIAPAKKGHTVKLTHSSGVRERDPEFSPDGKQIACVTDETGEQEVALLDAAGKGKPRILTHQDRGWIQPPAWSPDGKFLAYSDLTMALFLVDAATGDVRRVDASENAEIREYAFSPDGKWLAYGKREDDDRGSIYVYSVADAKSYAVTTPFTNDANAAWDPDGKYLYFLSNRVFNPVIGDTDFAAIVTRSAKPCLVILAKDGKSPFLPDELLEEPKKEEKKEGEAKADEKKPKLTDVKLDVEGIQGRVIEFPVPADNYSSLSAVSGKVFYVTSPVQGLLDWTLFEEDPTPRATLHAFDFKKKKDEVFIEKLRDYEISGDGKRIAWRTGSEIQVADAASKPGPEIEEKVAPSSLTLEVDPDAEWKQIYDEAWRLQRDFYWAENMAGIDWKAMGEKYRALLPRIGTREELNDLVGQLIGELATSHTYVFGGDLKPAKRLPVGMLGADIELDAASRVFRITRVCRSEPWETDVVSPLTMPHVNVHEGDFLFAVEGRDLAPTDSVDERLAALAGQQVLLTVGTSADRSDARDVQVETLRSDGKLRYYDWCRRNREYVEKKSGGRIGYFHLPDMMGEGLQQFHKGFFPQIDEEALLIDSRYNGGGFVSQLAIEVLSRKTWAFMRPRRGRTETYPNRVHQGYKAVLINQHAGSDGDIFPESFKLRKLGPVIGMRTWGGVIGINIDKRTIDGGLTTQPQVAWWEPTRGWDLENSGVVPDIEVDYRPEDWAAGRDPQIDRGIDELMKMLREKPIETQKPPPIPNKAPRVGGGR